MRKGLTAALVLCLTAGCVLFALGWRNAAESASSWETRAEAAEHRATVLEQALESAEAQRQALENDPIALFFAPLPYSGGTAGYLAYLEANAYRAELEHAAALLKDSGQDTALIDSFLVFIGTQAQTEAEAWRISLKAQGAVTAGAWAHVDQCQIPIYRFGAYALIASYQRTGVTYSYLFSPQAARSDLLDTGYPEEDLETN